MPTFVIERRIDGIEEMTEGELADLARTYVEAIDSLGVPYTWVTTFVAAGGLICIHEAEDAEAVIEHARRSGLPAHSVREVAYEIGPAWVLG